ncbi:ABC transporter ATP-binding protein [Pelomonas sp. CA6]|uniref:ABC transporter ATP-binding protein n=1 Tax=Pelomonas sp. CA6 TaxID=2907999 RepID=UPI001F4A81B3|nr:ABC transporter ATP-binding protein [Pelomonas sp. CA6]MCH7342950.1 ABC transporter ATP-binding protein [Pelomonas sp. CA6]
MSAVDIEQLTLRYGQHEVVPALDLHVEPGEFLVLLGPSGCGKSTLLHAIAGLTPVSAGRLRIAGRDMTEAEPAERGIGMVFQSYALYPTMTVERNMSFGLRVAGLPRAQIDERVQRAARMLQLEALLQRKPAQLSGGQRQRVAIGRALVREAAVYLFDEPLSNLDAQLRGELRRELKLLHQRLGATMIYVTHDQVEAMTLATRIAVMRQGRIQQLGTPQQVYERPANLFVAGFLGAPPMNLLPGTLCHGPQGWYVQTLALGALPLPAEVAPESLAEGRAVQLGLRPEQLLPDPDGTHEATLSVVERMGNHQVLWLEAQGQSLAALDTQTARGHAPGARLRLRAELTRASLFDSASGQRL